MLCAGQARVDRKAVARLLDGQWRKVTLHAERDLAHFTWSHDIYHNRTAKCAPIKSIRIGHPSMSENYKNYTL
jgi:hypothetical protein